MSEPEKHHYLPVFYLKQWANREGKIIRYYRPRPNDKVVTHTISPKNTGYERGLYGLEGVAPEAGRNSIEKDFMSPVVDDPAARALEVLIQRGNSKLTPEHRQAWIRFVMSLHVRNPDQVAHVVSMFKNHFRSLNDLPGDPEYDAVRGNQDPPTLFEWVEQNAPVTFSHSGKKLLPHIIMNPETGDAIIRMHWWVVGIPADCHDLLTCDRPVFMSHGVADERCFIAVPLSPRFAFFATHNQVIMDKVMSKGMKTVAKLFNESFVTQAEKHVYGVHGLHLRFVEQRLTCGK